MGVLPELVGLGTEQDVSLCTKAADSGQWRAPGRHTTVALACLGPGARIGSSFDVKSLFRVYSSPSTAVRNVPA